MFRSLLYVSLLLLSGLCLSDSAYAPDRDTVQIPVAIEDSASDFIDSWQPPEPLSVHFLPVLFEFDATAVDVGITFLSVSLPRRLVALSDSIRAPPLAGLNYVFL